MSSLISATFLQILNQIPLSSTIRVLQVRRGIVSAGLFVVMSWVASAQETASAHSIESDDESHCDWEVAKSQTDSAALLAELDKKLDQFDRCLRLPESSQNNSTEGGSGSGSGDGAAHQGSGDTQAETAVPEELTDTPEQLSDDEFVRRDEKQILRQPEQENDVAKMLWEAAEKESDASRKRELLEAYDNYMVTVKK